MKLAINTVALFVCLSVFSPVYAGFSKLNVESAAVYRANTLVQGFQAGLKSLLPFLGGTFLVVGLSGEWPISTLYTSANSKLFKMVGSGAVSSLVPLATIVSVFLSDKNKWKPYLACPVITGLGWYAYNPTLTGAFKGVLIGAAALVGTLGGEWLNMMISEMFSASSSAKLKTSNIEQKIDASSSEVALVQK